MKETGMLQRLVSLALMLALILSLAAPALADDPLGYIRITLDKVAVREVPAHNVLNNNNRLAKGTILAYSAYVPNVSGYDWVLVTTKEGITGYVRSDCYVFTDETGKEVKGPDQAAVTPTPTPTPAAAGGTVSTVAPAATVAVGTYGRTTTDKVFFRRTASTAGDYWALLPMNWQLEVLGTTKTGTGKTEITWYKVRGGVPAHPDNTYTGYIHSGYFAPIGSAAVTVTPTPTPASSSSGGTSAAATTGYVTTTLAGVNIRKTPAGAVLTPKNEDKIPVKTTLAYTDYVPNVGGHHWVLITYKGITGYIRSDCWEYTDDKGKALSTGDTSSSSSGSAQVPSGSQGYIKLTKGGVNYRQYPNGTIIGRLDKNTQLPYFDVVTVGGSEKWYYVYSTSIGSFGYILSTCAQVTSGSGTSTSATPTPTPSSSGSATGYVATRLSSVNLRKTAATNGATDGQIAKAGTVLTVTGSTVQNNGYTWYPVRVADGRTGYVRGDCVFEMSQADVDTYVATGKVTIPSSGSSSSSSAASSYVITTSDKLYVRKTPSKQADWIGQIAKKGSVYKFSTTQTVNKVKWYKITYNGQEGWIHGDYVRVLTKDEYNAMTGSSSPSGNTGGSSSSGSAGATTTAVPDPTTFSDVAFTTEDKVRVRAAASLSGKQVEMVYKKGTKLAYLGKYTTDTKSTPGTTITWYNIKYNGVTGWMHGDFIRILTQAEKKVYSLTGDPDAPQEAEYRTLSKGSEGDDVTALQQALAEKGYLAADQVSGKYLASTESAVIAFQKDNGLTQDGIAGEKTQHALFNTVPVGTYDNSTVNPTLYPVEKIDWYTGGIQNIWGIGVNAIITDVYTGISFRAQRLYGSNHADCEPLTAADTAAVCQIYGVSNAQEISDRYSELQSWRRRPLWVTVGGRTFAASMYGVPHNYDGDRIPDNNYNGQFCVHFVNSKTHGSSTNPAHVDNDTTGPSGNGGFGHQSAIQYAYDHSISGTK